MFISIASPLCICIYIDLLCIFQPTEKEGRNTKDSAGLGENNIDRKRKFNHFYLSMLCHIGPTVMRFIPNLTVTLYQTFSDVYLL